MNPYTIGRKYINRDGNPDGGVYGQIIRMAESSKKDVDDSLRSQICTKLGEPQFAERLEDGAISLTVKNGDKTISYVVSGNFISEVITKKINRPSKSNKNDTYLTDTDFGTKTAQRLPNEYTNIYQQVHNKEIIDLVKSYTSELAKQGKIS